MDDIYALWTERLTFYDGVMRITVRKCEMWEVSLHKNQMIEFMDKVKNALSSSTDSVQALQLQGWFSFSFFFVTLILFKKRWNETKKKTFFVVYLNLLSSHKIKGWEWNTVK